MKVAIKGASVLIGRALSPVLHATSHELMCAELRASGARGLPEADAVMHLAFAYCAASRGELQRVNVALAEEVRRAADWYRRH